VTRRRVPSRAAGWARAGAPQRIRGAAWAWGADRLQRAGAPAEAALLDAEVLFRWAAGVSREELLVRPAVHVEEPVWSAYADAIARRAGGTPVAYLVGRREFFGIDLLVDGRALIPRPETEHLVEIVTEALRGCAAPLIVDVGTGSGAVAIAVAYTLPAARVLATDVSAAALDLARINAARSGVEDRITWALGSALEPLRRLTAEESVDAIVSNPPYIPTSELARLSKDVREHEPAVALDGGPDGLDVHRPIVAGAARYLAPGGMLALEVAAMWDQAAAVADLIAATGRFGAPRIAPDYAGADRIVVAVRQDHAHHRR
jgi:release factor glutamine methyltransferase